MFEQHVQVDWKIMYVCLLALLFPIPFLLTVPLVDISTRLMMFSHSFVETIPSVYRKQDVERQLRGGLYVDEGSEDEGVQRFFLPFGTISYSVFTGAHTR